MQGDASDWTARLKKRLEDTGRFIKTESEQCKEVARASGEVAKNQQELNVCAKKFELLESRVAFLENMIDAQVYGEIAVDLDPLTAELQEKIMQRVVELEQQNNVSQRASQLIREVDTIKKQLQKHRLEVFLRQGGKIVERKAKTGSVSAPDDAPVTQQDVPTATPSKYLNEARKIFEGGLLKSLGDVVTE